MPPLTEHGRDIAGPTAARPTSADPGARYLDTDTGIYHLFDGTQWFPVFGRRPIVVVTGDTSLTQNQPGTLVVINAAASKVITLPPLLTIPQFNGAPVFTFVHRVATTSGAGHMIDTGSALEIIRGNGITPSAGKGIICTQATSRIGDSITLEGDISDQAWYITAAVGTWAREA